MNHILDRLRERFGPEATAAWLAAWLPNLVTALLVLAVFYLLWRLIDRAAEAVASRAGVEMPYETLQIAPLEVRHASEA